MKREQRLLLARCLDEGHDWRLVELYVEKKGKLKGTARREKLCQRCSGLKIEHISWRGEVIARSYKSDRDYIKASRELDKDVHERRRVYREQWLKQEFGRARLG